jgi:hypothetical protein
MGLNEIISALTGIRITPHHLAVDDWIGVTTGSPAASAAETGTMEVRARASVNFFLAAL